MLAGAPRCRPGTVALGFFTFHLQTFNLRGMARGFESSSPPITACRVCIPSPTASDMSTCIPPSLPQQQSPEQRTARQFQLSLARTEYN